MLAFEVLVWLTILCEVLKYGDSETCSSSVYRYRNPTKERPHLKEHPPTTFEAWMSIFFTMFLASQSTTITDKEFHLHYSTSVAALCASALDGLLNLY